MQHCSHSIAPSVGANSVRIVPYCTELARRRLLDVLLPVVVVLVCPGVAHAAQPRIDVTTSLTLREDRSGRLHVSYRLIADLPSHTPDVATLLDAAPGSPRYLAVSRRVVRGFGLFPAQPVMYDTLPTPRIAAHPPYPSDPQARPPRLRVTIDGDRARVRYGFQAQQIGCCTDAGSWDIERVSGTWRWWAPEARRLRVRTAAANVPANVRWTVRLKAENGDITMINPVPQRSSGDEATWRFVGLQRPVGVWAEVTPPTMAAWVLAAESYPTTLITPLLFLLALMVFPLVLGRRLTPELRAGTPLASWRPVGLLIFVGLIALSWSLSLARYPGYRTVDAVNLNFGSGHEIASLFTVAQAAVPVMATLAAIVVFGRRPPGSSLRWRVGGAFVFGLIFVIAIIVLALRDVRDANGVAARGPPWNWPDWIAGVIAVGVVVMTIAATAVAIVSILRRSGVPGALRSRRIVVTTVLGVCLFAGQWLWFVYDLADARAAQWRAGFGNVRESVALGLQRNALEFPSVFTSWTVDFVLLAALVSFWQVVCREPGSRKRLERAPGLIGVFAITFVWAVSSFNDPIYGLPVPLALALTLAAVAVVVRWGRAAGGTREKLSLSASGISAESTHDSQAASLALGPYDSPVANAEFAAKRGLVLLIPIALYVVGSFINDDPGVLGPRPFGFLVVCNWTVWAVASWSMAALAFGALFRALPGRHGVGKGLVLAAVACLPSVLVTRLPIVDVSEPWLFCAQTIAFFTILGALLDRQTLHVRGLGWDRLTQLYSANRWVVAVGYVLPILVSSVVLIQQVATRGDVGAGANALSEAVRNAAAPRP